MSSTAARSATRIGWLNCGTHTTMPWPTRMFFVCIAQAVRNSSGAERVRVLLEEVVLDGPHRVEAELVGEAHLLEGVQVHLALGLVGPRPRHGQLVEDAELHVRLPWDVGPARAPRPGRH